MSDKTKETYRLAMTVTPGGSGTLSRRLSEDGTLELVNVRIYPGAALNLQIKPMLNQLKGRFADVVDYTGKQYVDGDDDTFSFPVNIPVLLDNELVVSYVNNDLVNSLDFSVDFVIDHLGGSERVGG